MTGEDIVFWVVYIIAVVIWFRWDVQRVMERTLWEEAYEDHQYQVDVINARKRQSDEVEFPKMYRHLEYSIIVIFTSNSDGTVVQGDKVRTLGYHSLDWIECTDTSEWQPFHGTIELTQE